MALNLSGTTGIVTGNIASNAVTTSLILNANVTPAKLSQPMTLATAQNATGTSVDFTGIPSWVNRVTVTLVNVSTNGSSLPIIRLGSGTIQTSGYGVVTGALLNSNITTTGTSVAGFVINSNAAAASYIFGTLTLTLSSANTWTGTINMADGNGNRIILGSGNVALAGALDRVRITTVNGTDTFDGGSINILYEG